MTTFFPDDAFVLIDYLSGIDTDTNKNRADFKNVEFYTINTEDSTLYTET